MDARADGVRLRGARNGTSGSTLPMTDFNIAQPMPMLVVFLVTSMMTARPFLMVLAKW